MSTAATIACHQALACVRTSAPRTGAAIATTTMRLSEPRSASAPAGSARIVRMTAPAPITSPIWPGLAPRLSMKSVQIAIWSANPSPQTRWPQKSSPLLRPNPRSARSHRGQPGCPRPPPSSIIGTLYTHGDAMIYDELATNRSEAARISGFRTAETAINVNAAAMPAITSVTSMLSSSRPATTTPTGEASWMIAIRLE